MRLSPVTILVLAFFFIVGVLALQVGLYLFNKPDVAHEERIVDIPRGMSVAEISNLLAKKRVIESPKSFTALVRITGQSKKIKAAEYQFFTDMPPFEVLRILVKGVPFLRQVTVPEGTNMARIAKLFENAEIVSAEDFLKAAKNKTLLNSLGIKANDAEGYLFPETYYFPRKTTGEVVVKAMVNTFNETYDPKWDELAKMFNLSRQQLVTLASIIEKETSVPKERPIISAVFHNRLKKGMRLQSDPTVIYGIKDFDGNLKKIHLTTPHPHNTYTKYGLPAGPIASPGKESLEAALFPAQVSYLYFVSKNDGSHAFSKTYKEHWRAVQKYQIRRRSSR
ncbi:endolytic transglycosylase MltG [Bdellovibrionota bacterium]